MWSLRKPNWNRNRRTGESVGDAAGSYAASVGTILRQARQALGEDLRQSAIYLKIREPYLRAIEDGRYEDLPGRAYAVGFVRAYAIHLGLDGDKVVDRFKVESGDNEAQQELVIPEPASESSMPGGALIAASLMVAIAAYGGWYYLSTHHRLVTEAPSLDLPGRPAAVTTAPTATRSAPAPTVAPAPRPTVVASSGPVTVTPLASPAPSAPRPAAAGQIAAGQIASGQVAPGQGSSGPTASGQAAAGQIASAPRAGVESTAPANAPVLPPSMIAALPKVEPVAAAASEDADEAENGQVPPAPEPLSNVAGTAPATTPVAAAATAMSGAAEPVARPPISASSAVAATLPTAAGPARPAGPSRIIIRAIADSWLQVGDGRGTTLFAQVLRAGDSYHVPDRAGLRFDTGNAGGLEITVDGRPVPGIGPSGSVRRNIPLDIEKLVAGNFGQR